MAKYLYRYTNVPSLLQGDVPEEEGFCYRCRRDGILDFHHILNGTRKEFSEEEGLWVWLCRPCHRWIHDTPQGHVRWDLWKRESQKRFEETHDREEWMKYAHKNYIP